MIEKISISNFKCFDNVQLDLSSLNVFSGINGMGKSTVIQTLLLLKQSQEQNMPIKKVFLNGMYTMLGTGQDVLFENATDDSIKMSFFEKGKITSMNLIYDKQSDVLLLGEDIDSVCPSFDSNFEYISAERLAPKTTYEKSSLSVNRNQLGIYGQYTAHYLSVHQDDVIDSFGFDCYKTLKEGVQFWLNEISPNIKVNITDITNADLAQINYYYSGIQDSTRSREYRPTNVGFGISYILPIITALLKSTKGSMLIIENPEAHLHPKGQRKMGELIALCANKGVQIFLETHSDHVMNGIRISVKKKTIQNSAVKVYFFTNEKTQENGAHGFVTPKIMENGRFDFWPDGFFDEWEKALDEIV